MNNLTYKVIPKELYTSDRLTYADGVFRLNSTFVEQNDVGDR